jgi:Fe2+ or Zn2+ uptake regulation protein
MIDRDPTVVRVTTEAMFAGLRDSGLKITPQRAAIVRELAGDPSHPTAQEIFDRLRGSVPSMSFATVYNTLDALVRSGLCGALSLAPGATRFDANMHAHHHAVCDQCGMVRDVPREGPADLAARVPGFSVRAVERIYRGLCSECAGAAPPQPDPSH